MKTAAIIGTVLLPLLVLMTQSRAGFIALCVFVVLVLLNLWVHARKVRKHPRESRGPVVQATRHRLRRAVLGLAVIGTAVVFIAPTGVWERVQAVRQKYDPQGVFWGHIGQA